MHKLAKLNLFDYLLDFNLRKQSKMRETMINSMDVSISDFPNGRILAVTTF